MPKVQDRTFLDVALTIQEWLARHNINSVPRLQLVFPTEHDAQAAREKLKLAIHPAWLTSEIDGKVAGIGVKVTGPVAAPKPEAERATHQPR